MNKFREKVKKGNLLESVIDNIEEVVKYDYERLDRKHRVIIGQKRRLQYYKKLRNSVYTPCEFNKEPYRQNIVKDDEGKTIWFFWLQGLENAPEIVKACYESVKANLCNNGGWNIVVIDSTNIDKYVTLPEYIIDKYKKGTIPVAQFSDLLRLELLIKYGGLWVDSTLFFTGNSILDYCCGELLMPSGYYFFNGDVLDVNNWLMYANVGCEALKRIQTCLYKYWEKYDFLMDYFVFHIFATMVLEDMPEVVNSMPYLCQHSCEFLQKQFGKKLDAKVLQSILRQTDVHKLNYKDVPDTNTDGTYYEWIVNRYL